MKSLALVVLVVVAAACGRVTREEPGPADRFYRPTGVGVYAGNLVVASSNADLRFDTAIGGTVIAVDPELLAAPRLTGTLRIRSFAGQLAIADPAQCPAMLDPAAGALALVPVRGEDQLYRVRVGADGALSCDGCAVPVATPQVADAFTVGVACGGGRARAYVGYLRSNLGQAYITQVDLAKEASEPGAVQTRALPFFGQVRAFAHDAARGRLYFTHTVSGGTTTLDWIDLSEGCDLAPSEGTACGLGQTRANAVPRGLELRGIALASPTSPTPERAYLTARVYDPDAAASVGVRVGDFDGLLLVVDLVEDLVGELELRIVRQISIGYGASDVVRLPARAGRRDLVAALAADDGVLWIYDDETGDLVSFGRDAALGRPQVGRAPFGLAVDPRTPEDGAAAARVYVGSFEESLVTRIDVPFDDPAAAVLVGQVGGGTP